MSLLQVLYTGHKRRKTLWSDTRNTISHLGSWNLSDTTVMCDRSWARCPPRTESLTPLCFVAVMCLPDGPDLTLLILCSSCHTKVLVGCKLYKSRCLVCLWLAVPLKHFITNRTHGIFYVYSVSQCTTSSKAKSN